MIEESYQVGDQVEVFLDEKYGDKEGWHPGTIFTIDPYSEHRSFYWVNFDAAEQMLLGMQRISVFNPKNIRKINKD